MRWSASRLCLWTGLKGYSPLGTRSREYSRSAYLPGRWAWAWGTHNGSSEYICRYMYTGSIATTWQDS